jgi:hypothetical protein
MTGEGIGGGRLYQTDGLEIVGILTTLGYRDERMREALDLAAEVAGTQVREGVDDEQ